MDKYQDIAVLIVNDAHFPFLEIADLSTMKTGDDIYAIGAPKGMAYTLTKGGISAKERVIGNQSYIQIDAAINVGNSGGPLLNDEGKVLGVNTMKMSDSEGIGLAIPITSVCKYLNSLGIKLNGAGNVEDAVEISEDSSMDDIHSSVDIESKETQASNRGNEKNTPAVVYISVVVAVLSLAANVVLAVLLKNEKKKSAVVPYDPSERTDFDIDFLE
jgi:serine protease Do